MIDQCLVLADTAGALVELCGISSLERLLRTLQRCGFRTATVLASNSEAVRRGLARCSPPRDEIKVTLHERKDGPLRVKEIVDLWPRETELLLTLRADTIFDDRLVRLLATQTKTAVLIDRAPPPAVRELVSTAPEIEGAKLCGAAVLDYKWAAAQTSFFEERIRDGLANGQLAAVDVAAQPSYSKVMRRSLRPFWFPAPSPAGRKAAEEFLLRSVQKGAPDFPAWVHAPIENFLVARLCKTAITPNQLTLLTNLVAWTATIFFATGKLAWGIALALIVGVLDGLDGKLARVKVETTSRGKIEHWLDAVFEWSWWITLAFYFRASGQLPNALSYLALLALAEAIDGVLKGFVYFTTGRVIDELGTFERMVRLFGGRRNVYVWILTVALLLGGPAKGFILMALLQTLTAAAHLPSVLHLVRRRVRNDASPAASTQTAQER